MHSYPAVFRLLHGRPRSCFVAGELGVDDSAALVSLQELADEAGVPFFGYDTGLFDAAKRSRTLSYLGQELRSRSGSSWRFHEMKPVLIRGGLGWFKEEPANASVLVGLANDGAGVGLPLVYDPLRSGKRGPRPLSDIELWLMQRCDVLL